MAGGGARRGDRSARSFRPTHALLSQAAALDDALASWTVPAPGAALAGRLSAALSRRRSAARRLRLWLSGVGAAIALAGGVAAGIAFASPPPAAGQDALYTLTVLGAPVDGGSASGGG